LKARLLSASIALPIVVGFIFLGGVWFSVLMIFGASIAGYEASRMLRVRDINAGPIVSSISSGIVVLLAFIFSKTDITAYLFSLCVIIGGVASIIWISSVRVKNSSNILAITGIFAVIAKILDEFFTLTDEIQMMLATPPIITHNENK
jgi:CDP-diglyceride synthetase